MLLKIIKTYRNVVVICDSELLGKNFEEKGFKLEIKENFYGGEEKSREEIIKVIDQMSREDATFNIVGEKSVNLALETGMITKESVKKIQGIPFSFVLL